MLKPMIFLAVSAAVGIAAGTARSEADRHPGIYQFTPLPEGWCAARPPRSDLPAAETPRVRPLGDLPPAYVILVSAETAPAAPRTRVFHTPTPDAHPAGYDPCAQVAPTLSRVR